jgi:hypothetical protein
LKKLTVENLALIIFHETEIEKKSEENKSWRLADETHCEIRRGGAGPPRPPSQTGGPPRPPSRTGGPPSRSRSRNPSSDLEDDPALKKYQ